MKVLFDGQVFSWQRFGGVSRYFYELIRNLDADISYYVAVFLSNNAYIKNHDISNHFTFFPGADFKGSKRIIISANQTKFIIENKKKYDLIHPTYYAPYFLKYTDHKPFILTVHDMTHEKFPHFFPKNDDTTQNKLLLCKKATKIIAISQKTKEDIVEIFNINPDKISVVYEGQSLIPHDKQTLNLPSNYILYVGARDKYKNFIRFANAFSIISEKNKDIELICTGPALSKEEFELFNHLNLSNKVHHLYANDFQLSELYSRAKLFVYPSEYEGFGIPILEAFACNCPLLLSHSSCFPEIAQEGGLYFDPLSVDDMAHTIQKALDSDILREQLIENGKLQLSKFSWQKMGKEISTLYRTVTS